MLHPNFMKPGMYIMPPEAISIVYFINPSCQQNQHCSLSNCIVLVTSLHIHIKVFTDCSNTQTVVTGKWVISSSQNLLYTAEPLQQKMFKYIYVQIKIQHICQEALHINEMHTTWNIYITLYAVNFWHIFVLSEYKKKVTLSLQLNCQWIYDTICIQTMLLILGHGWT
jgi:hypothetical protein